MLAHPSRSIRAFLCASALSCAGAPSPSDEGVDCVPATIETFADDPGAYYRCVDAYLGGCGPDGYPLGYGAYYAEKYMGDTWDALSEDGQRFLIEVGVCLHETLATQLTADSTCDEVWDLGFDAHPDCYVDAGFCELPLTDTLAIAGAVEPEDQALPEQNAQVAAIAEACTE